MLGQRRLWRLGKKEVWKKKKCNNWYRTQRSFGLVGTWHQLLLKNERPPRGLEMSFFIKMPKCWNSMSRIGPLEFLQFPYIWGQSSFVLFWVDIFPVANGRRSELGSFDIFPRPRFDRLLFSGNLTDNFYQVVFSQPFSMPVWVQVPRLILE